MEFGPLARFERNRKGVTRAELFMKNEKIGLAAKCKKQRPETA